MSPIATADLEAPPTNGHIPTDSETRCRRAPIHANRHMRVVCIGAGASGIYMAYKLNHSFTDFSLDVYEKNSDISGTWYENRYPGCACDVPAHNYTYSFEPKSDWSANYATSKEIFKYFADFVDKYDLRKYITCNHEVVGAHWDRDNNEWVVRVRRPSKNVFEQRCDFLINAAGILNHWRWPAIPGLHSFQGDLVHSAAWDEKLDVAGKHVGLIGNGSSGIQILPKMQEQARHVTTFIREPTWVSPVRGMEYHEYSDEEKEMFRLKPELWLEMRKKAEKAMALVFPLMLKGSASQEAAAAYMKSQMVQKINNDELAQKLIPDFAVGCRRLTPGINYLENLTAKNVTALYGEITAITPTGCVTEDGKEHELDVLICATGFDTTFKPRFPLIGRTGKDLAKEWEIEPRSYLGMAAAGYPNYFMYLGPNCPIGNGPIIFSIEIQGEYIAHFMNRWQKEDILTFDPKPEAVDDFIHQKDLFMQETVWNSNCLSWYKNPHTGKITALWPGSTLHYMETLANPRYDDYNVEYRGRRFAYLGMGFSQAELDPDVDVTYYIRNKDDDAPLCRPLFSTRNAKDITPRMTTLAEAGL
ncbi:hypothetical protein AYO20_02059 [Fonsecaea nubica]|uniref:FAD/NAD(P)-binding domain-containing protein n=1 Tax=Fonsecaea nubica TaxID=856822 RepID=A0A178DC96_9EURO|nr:hypothetical protein AYO20_02059 [Fonsecaea nubica]OAL38853.1 hypothetical protein AYO20_02059 [Fonsecaea nubica]